VPKPKYLYIYPLFPMLGSQLPKPVSLMLPSEVVLGCGLSLARVWLVLVRTFD